MLSPQHRAPRRSINLGEISQPVSPISSEGRLSCRGTASSALPGMSQRLTLTATWMAGHSILQMLRDVPQPPPVPVTAAGNCKALLTPAKLWGDPLHPCRKALPGILQGTRTEEWCFLVIGLVKKRDQNQVLHEKGPRKSAGTEVHCFRLY